MRWPRTTSATARPTRTLWSSRACAGVVPGAAVLEIGCGTGQLTRSLLAAACGSRPWSRAGSCSRGLVPGAKAPAMCSSSTRAWRTLWPRRAVLGRVLGLGDPLDRSGCELAQAGRSARRRRQACVCSPYFGLDDPAQRRRSTALRSCNDGDRARRLRRLAHLPRPRRHPRRRRGPARQRLACAGRGWRPRDRARVCGRPVRRRARLRRAGAAGAHRRRAQRPAWHDVRSGQRCPPISATALVAEIQAMQRAPRAPIRSAQPACASSPGAAQPAGRAAPP